MTWLSKIEAENRGFRNIANLINQETTKERMARVIRELADVAQKADSLVKMLDALGARSSEHVNTDLVATYNALDNLSLDTKEVINEQPG